ncbi:MAG: hypothetical protein J0L64_24130 [Acidobacteria bacterium]|nr:hypothetical protein [Acidobacteriota bacterium]
MPELAAELRALLLASDDSHLAGQVEHLRVIDRCRCGDSFCATLYTAPIPEGSYGPTHRNVVLDPAAGMIVLDVVEERIVCVEILYRDELRSQILHLLP